MFGMILLWQLKNIMTITDLLSVKKLIFDLCSSFEMKRHAYSVPCRHAFLKFAVHYKTNVHILQVFVSNVPRVPGRSISDSIENFFNRNYPDHYLCHRVTFCSTQNNYFDKDNIHRTQFLNSR